jgi:hypothetical protein
VIEHARVVCYMPDKGAAYSHALRPASPKKAWSAVSNFLSACTEVEEPSTIRLVAHKATEWDDAALIQRCIEHTVARFGEPVVDVGGGQQFPSGVPVKGGYLEWQAPFVRFPEFRDYLIAGEWPKAVTGPVELSAMFRFCWRDPDGILPLPEQLSGHCTEDGRLRNELTVTLARRSSVSPTFWYPFAPDDARLADIVQLSAMTLPFRMSARHFRLAVPRADRGGYVFRRFDASGLIVAR